MLRGLPQIWVKYSIYTNFIVGDRVYMYIYPAQSNSSFDFYDIYSKFVNYIYVMRISQTAVYRGRYIGYRAGEKPG